MILEYINTRMEFEKTGKAAYISHLDLLSVMQRSLVRAGLDVRHTEGYNPHVYVSSLLPLSVGHNSVCEILEFGVVSGDIAAIAEIIKPFLPEGLIPVRTYVGVNKPALIEYAEYEITFTCERPFISYDLEALDSFLASESIVITRKSKRGERQEDIGGMIKAPKTALKDGAAILSAALPANSRSFLNPDYLIGAIRSVPPFGGSFARVCRRAILKEDMSLFE